MKKKNDHVAPSSDYTVHGARVGNSHRNFKSGKPVLFCAHGANHVEAIAPLKLRTEIRTGLRDIRNCTMKVGIITCMTCMFAVALTLRGPIRRQSSQSEKTVPIGGNVTLMCPLVHNLIWVYWKKNNHTIYSFEVQSNTQCTDGTLGTRFEGSNHSTHLTIKDLKKTDGGIYHCKVATSDTTSDNIKEGGRVLLSVTDQEGGLFTTSPGFPVRASTPMPPKPPKPPNTFYLAFSITLSILIIIIIIIIIITMCLVFKYRKQKAKSRFVKDCQRLEPTGNAPTLVPVAPNLRNLEAPTTDSTTVPTDSTPMLAAPNHENLEAPTTDSTPVPTDSTPMLAAPNHESLEVSNDPIHSSVQMPKHCQIIIDTPEFQRLRFIKQLGCTSYVFPSAVHTRFEHSIGVSHLGGKLASILQQNDRNSSVPIQNTEVACVEIAGLCHALGHGPFSHAFEDIVPPDKDGKKWKHEEQSVIVLKYLIKHNSLEKKLADLKIYAEHIDFICQLILGVKEDEEMLCENKFCLYQIVNNSVNGVDVNRWDYIARDTYYLGMKSAFDFDRILPFVKVLDVKRGSKTRGELCFGDKTASDLNQMFLTRRRLHYTAYQHIDSKISTVMLKDAFQEAADHLIFVGEGGKEYSLLESVKDPEAFYQVNDTIVNEIMRSRSQEPGMVKAREIIDRIHRREFYHCIAEINHAIEKMGTVDPAEIKRSIVTDVDELSSSSPSYSEIWQACNIEVEVSHFDYGSGNRNPLLDIPFYKIKGDGKLDAKLLTEHELPADLPQRLIDVTFRIYTKVPKLDRDTINKARSRCKTKLDMILRRRLPGRIGPPRTYSLPY